MKVVEDAGDSANLKTNCSPRELRDENSLKRTIKYCCSS
jgi:hypothetical protein